jgi:hypothetical protein
MKGYLYWPWILAAFLAGGFLGSYITNKAVSDNEATVYQSTPTKQKPKNEIPTIKDEGYETDEDQHPDTIEYLLLSRIVQSRTSYDNGLPSVNYYEYSWISNTVGIVGDPEYKGLQKEWLPEIDPKNTTFTGDHYLIRDFIVLSNPSGG